MIVKNTILLKSVARRVFERLKDTLTYFLRSGVVLVAAYFLLRPVVFSRFGTEKDGIPSLLGGMEHFRLLFYGLLPAVLLAFFLPRRVMREWSSFARSTCALLAGFFCACFPWYAAGSLRAAIIPSELFLFASLFIGINLAGMAGYYPAEDERENSAIARFFLRLFPVADVFFPGFVYARFETANGAGTPVLRIFPAVFLSIPLGIGLFHYLPDVDRDSGRPAGGEIVGDRSNDSWNLAADAAGRMLWSSAAASVDRFDASDGKWLTTGAVFPGSGVVKVGVDRIGRRLLGVAYNPDECVMALLDADSLATLETHRFPFAKRMELGGATVLWDEPAGILDVVYEGGIMRFSPDRRTLLQYAGCGWSSDAVLDPARRLLYVAVIFPQLLVAFDADTLRIKKQLLIPKGVSRMTFDPPTNRLFLSFPPEGVVRVVDIDRWEIVRSIPSFIGVRAIGLDKERDLLFFGGFSPYLEIRNLQNYDFLDRLPAPVWQRMILPSHAERSVFIASMKGVFKLPYPEDASFARLKAYDPFFLTMRALGRLVHWKINEPVRDFLPEEILPAQVNQPALP